MQTDVECGRGPRSLAPTCARIWWVARRWVGTSAFALTAWHCGERGALICGLTSSLMGALGKHCRRIRNFQGGCDAGANLGTCRLA